MQPRVLALLRCVLPPVCRLAVNVREFTPDQTHGACKPHCPRERLISVAITAARPLRPGKHKRPRGEIMADKRNRVSGRCRGDFPRTPEFAYGYAIRTIIHTQATRFWMQF